MSAKTQPRKRKPVVITRVESGFCQMFATFEMECPRCKVLVPAKTHHRCGDDAARREGGA